MDSNTDSTRQPTRLPEDGLDDLAVAVDRLVGQTLLAALEPLARPADATDTPQRWPAHR